MAAEDKVCSMQTLVPNRSSGNGENMMWFPGRAVSEGDGSWVSMEKWAHDETLR